LIANLKIGVTRLNRIVSDLITISLLKNPRQKYIYKSIDINKLSKFVFDELSFSAKQKNIKYTFVDNTSNPVILNIDENRIIQALENIVDNAIINTLNAGEVTLSLSILDDNFKRFIRISIKDNGKGIPIDRIPQLWEMFELVENIHHHHKGLGLGLPIAKKIIEDHHGEITVESKEKIGSEFIIILPIN